MEDEEWEDVILCAYVPLTVPDRIFKVANIEERLQRFSIDLVETGSAMLGENKDDDDDAIADLEPDAFPQTSDTAQMDEAQLLLESETALSIFGLLTKYSLPGRKRDLVYLNAGALKGQPIFMIGLEKSAVVYSGKKPYKLLKHFKEGLDSNVDYMTTWNDKLYLFNYQSKVKVYNSDLELETEISPKFYSPAYAHHVVKSASGLFYLSKPSGTEDTAVSMIKPDSSKDTSEAVIISQHPDIEDFAIDGSNLVFTLQKNTVHILRRQADDGFEFGEVATVDLEDSTPKPGQKISDAKVIKRISAQKIIAYKQGEASDGESCNHLFLVKVLQFGKDANATYQLRMVDRLDIPPQHTGRIYTLRLCLPSRSVNYVLTELGHQILCMAEYSDKLYFVNAFKLSDFRLQSCGWIRGGWVAWGDTQLVTFKISYS